MSLLQAADNILHRIYVNIVMAEAGNGWHWRLNTLYSVAAVVAVGLIWWVA